MPRLAGWAVAGLVVGGGVAALDRIALRFIQPPHKPLRRRATDLPFSSVPVPLRSGGQDLSAWILQPKVDAGGAVLILVHGWGSNHGTMARLAEPLLGKGFPVLLFDVRHHGESRGASYVTARHFRDDILAAVEAARRHFPGRTRVLVGHSMGGATGILAVAAGAQVQGLVSIGAPGDLWEVWSYHLDRKGMPGRWIVRGLSPFWSYRAGESWDDLDPRLRASDVKVPFLILHGEDDQSVPADHARVLAEAAGVDARILPGLGHTDLLEDPEAHAPLVEFLTSLPGTM